jgi:predicted amidophosphoribosyltransferase
VRAATGWDLVHPLSRRFGPSQVSVAPSERAANVGRSFTLKRGFKGEILAGRVVVLIDDVCTTGATLRTCGRLVAKAVRGHDRRGETRIWAGVLARTEPEKRPAGSR